MVYSRHEFALFLLVADSSPKSSLFSGDSSDWTTSLSEYPASSSWVAVCVFQKPGNEPLRLEATASGADHVFRLESEQSATLEPGRWNWAIRVAKDDTTKTVSIGETVVRPNPEGSQVESHHAKCVKLLRAAIEDRLVDVQESISVLGQDITKIPVFELDRLLNHYQSKLNRELRFQHQLITGQRQRRSRIYLVD